MALTPGTTAIGAAMQVGTRSVLNPMLWMCGIAIPTFTAGTLMAHKLDAAGLVAVFAVLAVAPPLVAMMAYVWFMFKDPDRLQSEPFRIEQQWVQAQIGDNRTQEVLTLSPEKNLPSANAAIEGRSDG